MLFKSHLRKLKQDFVQKPAIKNVERGLEVSGKLCLNKVKYNTLNLNKRCRSCSNMRPL